MAIKDVLPFKRLVQSSFTGTELEKNQQCRSIR